MYTIVNKFSANTCVDILIKRAHIKTYLIRYGVYNVNPHANAKPTVIIKKIKRRRKLPVDILNKFE